MDTKVKTLSDQMEEYSLRQEKIEKLKKELLDNPDWDIVEIDGGYHIKDMYGQTYPIDLELRAIFPQSYFLSAENDDLIIGVDPITKCIIYDCMSVGRRSIEVSEGIVPDLGDTMDGVVDMMKFIKDLDCGYKIPPMMVYQAIADWDKFQGWLIHLGWEIELKAMSNEKNGFTMDRAYKFDDDDQYKRFLTNELQYIQDEIDRYQKQVPPNEEAIGDLSFAVQIIDAALKE